MWVQGVGVPAGQLVANLDLVRPGTRGSEPIHEKDRPDHHRQQDHGYIGRYLDFIFHHRYLRALSKTKLSLNLRRSPTWVAPRTTTISIPEFRICDFAWSARREVALSSRYASPSLALLPRSLYGCAMHG